MFKHIHMLLSDPLDSVTKSTRASSRDSFCLDVAWVGYYLLPVNSGGKRHSIRRLDDWMDRRRQCTWQFGLDKDPID